MNNQEIAAIMEAECAGRILFNPAEQIEVSVAKIKKIKTWHGEGFRCDVLINGKCVGWAEDDSMGGCLNYEMTQEHLGFIEAVASRFYGEYSGAKLSFNADLLIGELVDYERLKSELKRAAKKAFLYALKDDTVGEYRKIQVNMLNATSEVAMMKSHFEKKHGADGWIFIGSPIDEVSLSKYMGLKQAA